MTNVNKTAKQLKSKTGERSNLSLVSTIHHPNVVIEGNILYHCKKDGKRNGNKMVKVGRKIEIVEQTKALEDKSVEFKLKIYTKQGPVNKVFSRSILVDRDEILSTVKLGSDISIENYRIYQKSLRNQAEKLSSKMNHKQIGWDTLDGHKIYKHENIISNDQIESDYCGELYIQSKGSLDEYNRFLKEEIIGHTPLEAAIALGLSAVVVGYNDSSSPHMFHIFGDSTTGKTTAGELIISLATQPTLNKQSLVMTWNATANAIVGKIRNLIGVPFLIDDSSVSRIRNFSTIIYQLAMGIDKERMNKESELKETSVWKTNIFSTGESSLLANSNENEGIKVRLSEFEGVKWTKSSEHSDRIKSKTQRFYGHGVQVLAKSLLELKENQIEETLTYYKNQGRAYLESKNKVNHLTDRKLKVYANIMLAIQVFEGALNLGFHLEKIQEFLLKHMFNDPRAMWKIAYDKLLEYVAANSNRFNKESYYGPYYGKLYLPAKSYNDVVGKIKDIKEPRKTTKGKIIDKEVSILYDKFFKTMKELEFTNPKSILRNFKENDLLNCEKDRYTRKRQISENSSAVNVVVLKIEAPYKETEEMHEAYEKIKRMEKNIANIDKNDTKKMSSSDDLFGKNDSKKTTLDSEQDLDDIPN